MQVGDALVRVHHRQFRTCLVDGLDICLDLGTLIIRQCSDLGIDIAEAITGIDAQFFECGCVFIENIFVIHADSMAEHDRIRDLHHGRFQMQRQQYTFVFCFLAGLLVKGSQIGTAHH